MPRTPTRGDSETSAGAGVLSRLMTLRSSLPPTSRKIADFLIANAGDAIHMSITEVAEKTGASEGSVVSLCRQAGVRGFQSLKISLAQDLVQPVQMIHEDLEQGDDIGTIVSKAFASNIQALQDTLAALDPQSIQQAVTAIREARRVEVYGIGSAAPVAEDLHYRLLRIGLDCRIAVDSHVQAISASLTGPGVVTITISHSGSTKETVLATRLARQAGARTICITNYGRAPIHAHSDIVLPTVARETAFRTEAMTSRIAQLAVIDALVASLAMSDYDNAVDVIHRTFEVLSAKRY